MCSLPIQRLRLSGALLLVSCTSATFGCSSGYEPDGQFWTNSGPVSFGVGSTAAAGDDAGANDPTGGANGATADSTDEGPSNSIRLDEGSSNSNNSAGGGSSMGGGSAVAGGTSAPSGAGSQTCSLSVSVTTTAPGGKYRPRNVGAIWIADSSGRFVKSLDVWGNRRLSHVTAWTAATRAAGAAGNKVDAVSSATLTAHRAHNVNWNCQDYRGQVVPDGTYRVYFEVTDRSSSGPNHFETFTKGPMAATVQGSATNFNGIALTFKP
jgi:hypothetical protein